MKNSFLRVENDRVFFNKCVTKLLPISLRLVPPHTYAPYIILLDNLPKTNYITIHSNVCMLWNLNRCFLKPGEEVPWFKSNTERVKANKYFYPRGLLNLFFRNGLIYAVQRSPNSSGYGTHFYPGTRGEQYSLEHSLGNSDRHCSTCSPNHFRHLNLHFTVFHSLGQASAH